MLNKLTASCITLAAFAGASIAQGINGTCTINAAKSHYTSQPPQKADSIKLMSDATTQHLELTITMPDGQTMHPTIAFPVAGGAMELNGFPPDPKIDHATAKVVSKDKWVFSYFDKDNKLTSTRVITYSGKQSEAKWMMKGKVVDDEICEMP